MKIVLIPCAPTEWRDEGRLLGRVELAPTPAGEQQAAAWSAALAQVGAAVIHHSPDELATRTAKILSKAIGARPRKDSSLAEVDLGLWSGLTDEELRKRFASAHHELLEAPLNVNPPDGEGFSDASERVAGELKKLIRRTGDKPLAVVLRPVALGLARRWLEGSDESTIWEAVTEINEPIVFDYSGNGKVTPATPPDEHDDTDRVKHG
ncbi:MAG: histidine phosphatase family protein [Phycisphaerales bacterium]|nr:histidine phosphatase family protein [Phycisphaerales bacterium]